MFVSFQGNTMRIQYIVGKHWYGKNFILTEYFIQRPVSGHIESLQYREYEKEKPSFFQL